MLEPSLELQLGHRLLHYMDSEDLPRALVLHNELKAASPSKQYLPCRGVKHSSGPCTKVSEWTRNESAF